MGKGAQAILGRVRGSIPAATIARLPLYLRCLSDLDTEQNTFLSGELAQLAGIGASQVRRDLSYLDAQGVRGVGYEIDTLCRLLRTELGLTRKHRVAIAGAGNLGRALAVYPGFATSGFEVAVLFDVDDGKIGSTVHGITVEPMQSLESVVASERVNIGIIATPAASAQDVADRFVAADVRSILNFAPAVLGVADGVQLRRVDLSTELQILAFHEGVAQR